jgi:excisionase family DNA binding protein
MANNDLLRYRDVVELYGLPLGTLYSMVNRREIPHIRLGPRSVRFSRLALEQWLSSRVVPAT